MDNRELIERANRSLQLYKDADTQGKGSVGDALDIWEEYQIDLIAAIEAQEQRIQELEGEKVRLLRKLRRIEAECDRWQRLCNAAEGELERG